MKNIPHRLIPLSLTAGFSPWQRLLKLPNGFNRFLSRPFGYPRSLTPPFDTADEATRRLNEISDPASSWALVDVDQQNGYPAASYYWNQPVDPAHGTVRNELFFDGHVAAVPR